MRSQQTLLYKLSIVIPSWNGRDLLAACLESIRAQTFHDFEVVVVDDGSSDNTAEMLAQRYPDARVIRTPENVGFCNAVNAGIQHNSGDLVLLLNNDMTLDSDFLAQLVAAADATTAALFAPLVLWRDDPEIIYSAGDKQFANGRPESVGFRCKLEGFPFTENVFGVSAGAGLYRRAVFDSVGLLDPRFNIYFSDSDLSFRARLAGFEARFVRGAVAYHVGSASLFGRTLKRTQQCFINHVMLVVKNMPARLWLRYAGGICAERLHQARRLFSAARVEFGAFRAGLVLLQSAVAIARLMPHALRERRRIQRTRRVTDDALEALLSR